MFPIDTTPHHLKPRQIKIAMLELVTMKFGDCSSDVLQLQHTLNEAGYSCGEADGCFGQRTKAAVIEVQRHFGLEADGIFGPATWYALSFWAEEEGTSPIHVVWQPWQQLWAGLSAWLMGIGWQA